MKERKNYNLKTLVGKQMDEEGIVEGVYESSFVSGIFTKRYHNCLDKKVLLNYCEHYLLDWLAERAVEDCMVDTSKKARIQFIGFMDKITSNFEEHKRLRYADSTVKNALQTLKKVEFLIQPPGEVRGWCWINPVYFFRGSEEEQKRAVKRIKKHIEDYVIRNN